MSKIQEQARRFVVTTAILGLVGAGGVLTATAASAAPSCTAGYVCTWSGTNGTGTTTKSANARNYTTKIASVFYNYQSVGASFWTANKGGGQRITGYTTSERGFRNWSTANHDRCKSHIDSAW